VVASVLAAASAAGAAAAVDVEDSGQWRPQRLMATVVEDTYRRCQDDYGDWHNWWWVVTAGISV